MKAPSLFSLELKYIDQSNLIGDPLKGIGLFEITQSLNVDDLILVCNGDYFDLIQVKLLDEVKETRFYGILRSVEYTL